MPIRNGRGENNRSPYDEMSDEMLREILRADAEKPEDGDIQELLCVMEVLASRNQNNEEKDPKEAFKAFKKYYLSDEIPAPALKKLPAPKTANWKRSLTAAAAALAILVGGTATVGALDADVVKYLPKWTDEIFTFVPVLQGQVEEPYDPNSSAWAELRALLWEHGITADLIPTWVPEGYELYDTVYSVAGDFESFYAAYTKDGEELLSANVFLYRPEGVSIYPKSPGDVEVYRAGGVDYYIFFNLHRVTVAWINQGYQCSLSGPVTVQEAKKMIDSITKG